MQGNIMCKNVFASKSLNANSQSGKYLKEFVQGLVEKDNGPEL